jgi:hypothetical protein
MQRGGGGVLTWNSHEFVCYTAVEFSSISRWLYRKPYFPPFFEPSVDCFTLVYRKQIAVHAHVLSCQQIKGIVEAPYFKIFLCTHGA